MEGANPRSALPFGQHVPVAIRNAYSTKSIPCPMTRSLLSLDLGKELAGKLDRRARVRLAPLPPPHADRPVPTTPPSEDPSRRTSLRLT